MGSLAELDSSAFSGLQTQLHWGSSYMASVEQASVEGAFLLQAACKGKAKRADSVVTPSRAW